MKRKRKPKQPKYKPSVCRYCGKTFTYENPEGTKRIGGRQAVYCSDECREKWRKEYKHKWALKIKRDKTRQLQRDGIEATYIDFKRDRELEQLVMELELYPELIKNLYFKLDFRDLGFSEDKAKVKQCLYLVDELELSSEHLENTTSWYLDEIGIDL